MSALNCRDLSTLRVITDQDLSEVGPALRAAGLGYVTDAGTAMLDVYELARLTGHDDHDAKWEAMLSFAASRGWLIDERLLAAHLEREESTSSQA